MIKLYINIFKLSILFSTFNSYCQNNFKPGYLLGNNNDTIFGLIDLRSDYQNSICCTFKKNNEAEKEEFYPDQIQSYRIIEGKYYVSKSITLGEASKNVFLEYLVNGYAKLYYYKDRFDKYYFIETDSGKTVVLENNEIQYKNQFGDIKINSYEKYKGVLRYIFKDDENINKQIDKTKFNSESLIRLNEKYHHDMCPDKECIVYIKKSSFSQWINISAGSSYESLKLNDSKDKALQNRIFISLLIRQTPKLIYPKWSFLFGAKISRLNTEGNFVKEMYHYQYVFHVTIKSTMIEVPFQAAYTLFQGKFSGEIYGGINAIYYINPEYNVTTKSGSTWETKFEKWNYGINAGIDLKYLISKNTNIILICGFEYRTPIFKSGYLLQYSFFNGIPISLGLEHKFK